jgi:hypothetical protein
MGKMRLFKHQPGFRTCAQQHSLTADNPSLPQLSPTGSIARNRQRWQQGSFSCSAPLRAGPSHSDRRASITLPPSVRSLLAIGLVYTLLQAQVYLLLRPILAIAPLFVSFGLEAASDQEIC